MLIKGRSYKTTREESYEEPLPGGGRKLTTLETELVVTDITTVDEQGEIHSHNGHARQNGRSVPRQTLLYGDGTPVAADNETERSTYARYRQAKGSVPPSKHVLLQYYRQQTAV
jgi:hypothetical protein